MTTPCSDTACKNNQVPLINYRVLEAALRSYHSSYELLCNNKKYVTVLPKYVSEQYRLTKSVISADLEMAQLKRHAEDFGAMVFHLECALSALHDILGCTDSSINFELRK